MDEGVDNPDKLDELFIAHQATVAGNKNIGSAHCGDYCAFLGYVGAKELRALGVMDEVLDDSMWDDDQKDMIQNMVNGGSVQGYLFQCLHCGKHLLWVDVD